MEYDVKGHLHQILDTLPQGVRLVAISKYHPQEYIEAAYAEGQRVFGESHEQELRQKHEALPSDIEWFFPVASIMTVVFFPIFEVTACSFRISLIDLLSVVTSTYL